MSVSCIDVCEVVYESMCEGCPHESECHPDTDEHDDEQIIACLIRLPFDITGPHREACPG